jgi:RNA polymerase sigma-70 factor (ECF subfamily)
LPAHQKLAETNFRYEEQAMSDSRLSRIETQWSMIQMANQAKHGGADKAQTELFERYAPAIRRYLRASLRNEEAAADVFQEFALRLVRGDFRNADCAKGRFRSMLKTALYRLMVDYHRRNQKQKKLGSGHDIETWNEPETMDQTSGVDDEFTLSWRQSLLDEAWNRLEQLQIETGKPYFTILKTRVDQPLMTTKQLHQFLTDSGASIPAENSFRVYLHRARKRFATILLDQVAQSLEHASRDDVEAELIELGLHHFCKPAFAGQP